ncbi:MAG: IS6 family transposase [Candidatus Bathyarchaeia archaeon]
MKLSLRELRGLSIVALGGQIKKADESTFLVRSQSDPSSHHKVKWNDDGWVCDCADYAKRRKPCKHIYAVNFLLDLPRIVLLNSEAFTRTCPYCGSADVRPKGFRYNKSGPVRMFRCRRCKKRFRDNATLERGGARVALAVIAADLYYKGLSLRDIANHLWQVYGVDVSPATVHHWVMKITNALKRAFEEFKLEVGDKWLADETVVKVNGEHMYLWNIMDRETRAYIASLLTPRRDTEDAIKAVKEAIKNAGKIPKMLVTDGLQSYRKALELLDLPVEHIGNAGLAKDENNNMVERLHGTIKEWIMEKRGAREKFEEIVSGYRIYYNYLRPNTALNEETPTNAKEKWVKVILHPSNVN